MVIKGWWLIMLPGLGLRAIISYWTANYWNPLSLKVAWNLISFDGQRTVGPHDFGCTRSSISIHKLSHWSNFWHFKKPRVLFRCSWFRCWVMTTHMGLSWRYHAVPIQTIQINPIIARLLIQWLGGISFLDQSISWRHSVTLVNFEIQADTQPKTSCAVIITTVDQPRVGDQS